MQASGPPSEKSLGGVHCDFHFAASWGAQFRVLMRRAWLQTSRDKMPLIITVVQARQFKL